MRSTLALPVWLTLFLSLSVSCQSQKSVGTPNTPPPDPPREPKEIGRRQGGGLLPSGCGWSVDAPFIEGDFPMTREFDRFYEDTTVRMRKEQESYCRTSCGAPNDTFCPGGFPPKEPARSLTCKGYRIDRSVISIGCLETRPAGAASSTEFHGLNLRAEGAIVRTFDLESFFVPGSPWPDAVARSMVAHDKDPHVDWVKVIHETSPPSMSPVFFHMNVTKTGFVFTLMNGVVPHARWGETHEVPFADLTSVLATSPP